MPNWCYNHVEISGPEESLKKFYDLLLENAEKRLSELSEPVLEKEEYISLLETFFPASDYFRSMEGYNNGGYEWCLANWGCKWPERVLSSFYQKEEWEFIFETPWSPPLTGYQEISKMFPDLMFLHYFEDEGFCFVGACVYQNGIEIFMRETDDISPYLEDGDVIDYDDTSVSLRQSFIKDAKQSFTLSI